MTVQVFLDMQCSGTLPFASSLLPSAVPLAILLVSSRRFTQKGNYACDCLKIPFSFFCSFPPLPLLKHKNNVISLITKNCRAASQRRRMEGRRKTSMSRGWRLRPLLSHACAPNQGTDTQ